MIDNVVENIRIIEPGKLVYYNGNLARVIDNKGGYYKIQYLDGNLTYLDTIKHLRFDKFHKDGYVFLE